MNSSVIISPRVIDTINSLSSADRTPISNALSMEFILGQNPEDTLTPNQSIIYAVIRFYVTQDTARHRRNRQTSVETTGYYFRKTGSDSAEKPSRAVTAYEYEPGKSTLNSSP